MLVLSRHETEQILIGEDIVVTIVRIERDKVKIGIEAPMDVRIDRPEIRASKDREEREMDMRLRRAEGDV